MNLPIHPFPARMAPELALDALQLETRPIRVLDPMSGSGTALRHASELGHEAHGRDLDPLAVLMAKVWTTKIDTELVEYAYSEVIKAALSIDPEELVLPWIDGDEETEKFTKFWFGKKQRNELRCLAGVLSEHQEFLPPEIPKSAIDVLRVAMSRIIVTKEQRASLARDTSHSRPHKVTEESGYDVFQGFRTSKVQILRRLSNSKLIGDVSVKLGDARVLDFLDEEFDLIITSPPYLNAIDYMRGHRLGLVWLGYSISELRSIRSSSIGAEKAPNPGEKSLAAVKSSFGALSSLPSRYQSMIERYSIDLTRSLSEAARVLKQGGYATYVVGNSCLKGVFVSNSNAVAAAGELAGLCVVNEVERELPQNRRYLPIDSESSLSKRIRTETILTFRKS